MDDAFHLQCQLHARLGEHQHRVRCARHLVELSLETGQPPYVALSGGKDSTVVLALAQEQCSGIPAVWSDDEWFLPETAEYMERVKTAGVTLHQIRTNASHTDWFQIQGDWNGIQHYAKMHNWGLVFLGLRQEESVARRLHLRTSGPLFFAQSDDFWHCNPIHNWTWRDVWAYIVDNDLDYNRAYDRLAEIGVPPERQRIGPLAVERVLGYGQIAILKRGWPDLFNRFAAEFPEGRAYT